MCSYVGNFSTRLRPFSIRFLQQMGLFVQVGCSDVSQISSEIYGSDISRCDGCDECDECDIQTGRKVSAWQSASRAALCALLSLEYTNVLTKVRCQAG